MISFLSGIIDLGVGWLEQHETIFKDVIRVILISPWLVALVDTSLEELYIELVGLSDGAFSDTLGNDLLYENKGKTPRGYTCGRRSTLYETRVQRNP